MFNVKSARSSPLALEITSLEGFKGKLESPFVFK
jgi:hypothetical protein